MRGTKFLPTFRKVSIFRVREVCRERSVAGGERGVVSGRPPESEREQENPGGPPVCPTSHQPEVFQVPGHLDLWAEKRKEER